MVVLNLRFVGYNDKMMERWKDAHYLKTYSQISIYSFTHLINISFFFVYLHLNKFRLFMGKWILILMPLVLFGSFRGIENNVREDDAGKNNSSEKHNKIDLMPKALYDSISCEGLDYKVFSLALKGYQKLKDNHIDIKKDIITVIDFDKPSTQTRMFVIDLKNRLILRKGLVAHGRNSGDNIAQRFSNQPNSLQSSLGFYLTGETYIGKHGLSIRLDGLEKEINSNARRRNIVIHNADYVSEQFVKRIGRLGRSFGCPAFQIEGYKEVVEAIKGKSLLFIYSSKTDYLEKSTVL